MTEIDMRDPRCMCNGCLKARTVVVDCVRCNDNGCPACDGTKGDKHNPEPY